EEQQGEDDDLGEMVAPHQRPPRFLVIWYTSVVQVVKKVPSQPSRGPATGFGGGTGGITGKLLLPVGAALTITGLVLAVVALRRPRLVRGAGR
ncbi:hypothetical protein ACWCO3_30075, partial [Micromonospora sp. NPDC002411]